MAPTRNYPMCENSTRYNRTRNFGLYGHAESKKKRKNLSSARHYDQIRFRFHTAKTLSGHFFTGSAKVSSPDHLVKNRLISSKNRAAAGSCTERGDFAREAL